jgi:hypothetical protein
VWQDEISAIAARKGYRSAENLLADAAVLPWQPATPWYDLPERHRSEALQWREALAQALARQHEFPPAEMMAKALASAGRVFGREISAATVRRRFDLACARDRAFLHWARPEIYLSEAASAVGEAAPERTAFDAALLAPLIDAFNLVKRPDDLTEDERLEVWRALVTFPGEAQSALDYTFRALPSLARSRKALGKTYRKRLRSWRQSGGVLSSLAANGRKRSGRRAKCLCPRCLDLVKGAAIEHDGNLALAWRRVLLPPDLGGIRAEGEGVCDKCAGLWHFDPRTNKSYVPAAVRRQVLSDVAAALPWRHGAKRSKLLSPYIPRDPRDIGPGSVFEADDVTWNHIFWDTADSGKPFLCRGECLLVMDRRTGYPVAYRLIAGRLADDGRKIKAIYTGLDVRLAVLRAHDSQGLPHEQFLFENGIWKSRLVDGPKVKGWSDAGWPEMEAGLNEIGILCGDGSVRHAEPGNPRTKLIEGRLGKIQERMRPQAGFVGFNHRDYAPQKVNELIRKVKAGLHPGDHFHSFPAFRDLLDSELLAYANEPQNGAWLPGVSPREAWLNGIGGKPGIGTRPLRKLPAEKRYLLSTHRREIEVDRQGIIFLVGGRKLVFWGPELAPFQRQRMLVRWNLEKPTLLHCLPPGGEPFTLTQRIQDSTYAAPEKLADAGKARRAFVNHGKAIYDNMAHPFLVSVQNDGETTPEHARTAAVIAAGEAAEAAREREEKAEARRRKALSGALQLTDSEAAKLPPARLERMAAAHQRRLDRTEDEQCA